MHTIDTDAFRAFEQRIHDRLAESYHRHFSAVTAHAIGPLLGAAGPLSGRRLLDIASGPGALVGAALAAGARATGLDLSPRMVALASRLHPAASFREGDAESLPFDDGTFDVVTSAFGVGHFPEASKAAAEWRRVLAPGGRVAIAWWDQPERACVNGIFFSAVQALGLSLPAAVPAGPPAFRYSSPDALRALLEDAGFASVAVETHVANHVLPDEAALWDLARGSLARIGALIESLDGDGRATLAAEVSSRLAPWRRDGVIALPAAFLVASGARPADVHSK